VYDQSLYTPVVPPYLSFIYVGKITVTAILLPYRTVAQMERPLSGYMLRGNRPPVLLTLCDKSDGLVNRAPTSNDGRDKTRSRNYNKKFSSVSRSRKRSESTYPFRTFTLLRIAVGRCPHTIFDQRGSVFLHMQLYVDKHTSKILKSQIERHGFCVHDSRMFMESSEQCFSLSLVQAGSDKPIQSRTFRFLANFSNREGKTAYI
jgi:hypothetical protein